MGPILFVHRQSKQHALQDVIICNATLEENIYNFFIIVYVFHLTNYLYLTVSIKFSTNY